MIEVPVVLLPHADGLALPAYATPGSAGLDLVAAISEPIEVKPGARVLVPTGLKIALPEGFEAQVRPRSGLAINHGVTVINSPGTIDADYRGEIKVALVNLGSEGFTIVRGLRVAQLVLAKVETLAWKPATDLPTTQRGSGGFGSTGTR